MAVTIHTTPKDYAPVYNKMEYLVDSTNSGNTNFSYLVDIYVNGGGTRIARLRIPPQPTTGYGVIDIHRILEATLTSDVPDTKSIVGTNDTSSMLMTYIVKFGEEYDVTGTLTQFPDLTVDSIRYAINASLEKREFINWDITAYDLDGITKKFLTNMPDNHNVSILDYGYLYFKETNVIVSIDVTTYDLVGNSLAAYKISPDGSSTIQYVASAPASLNTIKDSNLIAGVQPIITSNVGSYTIKVLDAVGTVSETRTFVIKEPCKLDSNRLLFLNKLGAFDGFTFFNGSSHTNSIERKNFKKQADNIVGTNIVYSLENREKETFYTKTSESIKLISDWITENEDAWLLELIESPEIYLLEGDSLVSVESIKATSHKKRKHVTDKAFNLEVEIVLGHDNYRQRG